MSGARPYSPREDMLIRDVCGQTRPARIRSLARELGRSETGIRRRWQRLLRGGGSPFPDGRTEADELFETIHSLAREAEYQGAKLRSIAAGLYQREPDAGDRLARVTGTVRSLGAEIGLLA